MSEMIHFVPIRAITLMNTYMCKSQCLCDGQYQWIADYMIQFATVCVYIYRLHSCLRSVRTSHSFKCEFLIYR